MIQTFQTFGPTQFSFLHQPLKFFSRNPKKFLNINKKIIEFFFFTYDNFETLLFLIVKGTFKILCKSSLSSLAFQGTSWNNISWNIMPKLQTSHLVPYGFLFKNNIFFIKKKISLAFIPLQNLWSHIQRRSHTRS